MNYLEIFDWTNTKKSIHDLQELLKCPLCHKEAVEPVLLSSCQHSFCSVCLKKHFPQDVCPKCGMAAPPATVKTDHTSIELAAAAGDLVKMLQGKTIDTNRSAAPPSKTNPINPPPKDKGASMSAKKKSSTRIPNLSIARPVPNLEDPLKDTTKTAAPAESRNDCKYVKQTEPPFTPPVDAPVLPSALVKREGGPSTPNTKISTRRAYQGTPNTSLRSNIPPCTPKLDKRNTKGETALHVACVKGDLEAVRKLLSEKANPNTRDHAGWTPLHEACQQGHVNIAEELLKSGALVDVPSWEGNTTPLHDAVEHGRDLVVKMLRKYGASDDIRDIFGRTPRDVASLCNGASELHSALNTPPDVAAMKECMTVEPQRTHVLLSSNLPPLVYKQLTQLSKLLKIKLINEYSPEVSHIIVHCEGSLNICLRTAKFMTGIVAGKWIVSHHWISESLEKKSLVDPKKFEVTGSTQNVDSGAPQRARLNANKMLPGLLSGCHVYLHGQFGRNSPSRRELEVLVKAGGGKLLLREPNAETIPPSERTVPFHATLHSPLAHCSHYIIYQEGSESEPKLKYDMAHIKSLPLTWLIDCIDHFQLLPPFSSYCSQSC